jgi:uncharacterized protein
MRLVLCLCLSMLLAPAARADVAKAVRDHVLPGYAAFADATGALSRAAGQTCDADALRPLWHAAADAWMGVSFLRVGPVETDGMVLAIAFWPDPKGLGIKAQKALLAGDPALLRPDAFAQQSVAARGLTGLERLLWATPGLSGDTCPLIRATAADLAAMAARVAAEWVRPGGFADTVLTAGQPGNAIFLTTPEAAQALFTQVHAGLEAIKDQRLGRPLGTFDRPRPDQAEARVAGRSLRNVVLGLTALRATTASLTPDALKTLVAFDQAIALAKRLEDPVFASVATPQGRLRVEILQQAVDAVQDAATVEMSAVLGVDLGFNAADGD